MSGTPADLAPVSHPSGPESLAAFLHALHHPAPPGAPDGRGERGRPIAELDESVTASIAAAADLEVLPRPEDVQQIRAAAVSAPPWVAPPIWLDGDLHPANVLTASGALTGVIDFGDLHGGDPALDVAASWILLPDLADVQQFRSAYRPAIDDATWQRAKGWAIWRSLGSLFIAEAGRRGEPGGKPTWGPPATASLNELLLHSA